jgi:hypothetical protein
MANTLLAAARGCHSSFRSCDHIGPLPAFGAVGSERQGRLAAEEARRLPAFAERKATLACTQLEQGWMVRHRLALGICSGWSRRAVALEGHGWSFVSMMVWLVLGSKMVIAVRLLRYSGNARPQGSEPALRHDAADVVRGS